MLVAKMLVTKMLPFMKLYPTKQPRIQGKLYLSTILLRNYFSYLFTQLFLN